MNQKEITTLRKEIARLKEKEALMRRENDVLNPQWLIREFEKAVEQIISQQAGA